MRENICLIWIIVNKQKLDIWKWTLDIVDFDFNNCCSCKDTCFILKKIEQKVNSPSFRISAHLQDFLNPTPFSKFLKMRDEQEKQVYKNGLIASFKPLAHRWNVASLCVIKGITLIDIHLSCLNSLFFLILVIIRWFVDVIRFFRMALDPFTCRMFHVGLYWNSFKPRFDIHLSNLDSF